MPKEITPYKRGEWKAARCVDGTWIVETEGDVMCVQESYVSDDTYDDANHMEKKFKLIAKVPDMVDALQRIEGGFINTDFVMSNPPDWHSAFNELQAIARKLLTEIRNEMP